MGDTDIEQLRATGLQVLEHLLGQGPERKAIRSEYEDAFRRVQSPRGINQLLCTMLRWADALPAESLSELEGQLVLRNHPTLSWLRSRSQKQLRAILARGRIETRDEDRVVDWFTDNVGPAGPTPDERHRALLLLNKYAERDHESAFTAPLSLAWRAAAHDLGVRLIAPYELSGNGSYWCCGLLPDFGAEKGTVILGRYAPEDADEMASSQGFYTSGLSPLYYDYYDRMLFESTLDDWGWFGQLSEVPTWFKGGLGVHGGPMGAA